ncbi:hypothetical protein D3C81_1484660 [compost metagenome]
MRQRVGAQDQAAREQAHAGAHRAGCAEDAHRTATLVRREQVGHQRDRTREQHGLAHRHRDARGQQVPVVVGQAAGSRRQAPHCNADGDDRAAVAAVDEPCDRQAHHAVEGREGEAVEQADLGVVDPERLLDRTDQQGQDLPVHDGKDVGDQQYADGVPGTCLADTRRGLRGRVRCLGRVGIL